MGLQNEVRDYLSKYGITKSHMAKTLDISAAQLTSWMTGRLVLPDYHMVKIREYLRVLESVDSFLYEHNMVL
ncbi:hypothetical protein [Anaerotignum sp.]